MIPKTDKIERLRENFDVFWKEVLNEEEMADLEKLNKNLRTVDPLSKIYYLNLIICLGILTVIIILLYLIDKHKFK